MNYPTLIETEKTREVIDVFGGYNHNLRINDGEFYDMENLTSTYYPVLSPREKRGTLITVSNPQGMIAKDSIYYVDGEDFVVSSTQRVNLGLSTDAKDCPKTLISMGAYVIILPDKKYINTADVTEFGSIEAEFTTAAPVSFSMCKIDGSKQAVTYTQSSVPTDPANMDIWLDTSTTPHSLKQYSSTSSMWVSIATTYIKIESAGIGAAFEQYDGVTISGMKDALIDNATGAVIEGESASQLAEIDGSMIIWDRGDDYIVVVGILDKEHTISNSITVERRMPSMDFVIESDNRLWGCRYGTANNGEVVNEIYASKQGDFKNWNCFMGLSTDSYTASCGTDGRFTGAIAHLGYPLFFKEHCMHKVYGNYPANYQIQTTACRGVQNGSGNSLAIVNEVLYYKSTSSICAYDGSLPADVSSALGDVYYQHAVACGHGNKYYISMMDMSGDYHLFVYDTIKGMWHREDNTRFDFVCSMGRELFYIEHPATENEERTIRTMFGGLKDNDPVKWMAETGIIGVSSPDKKYISKLDIRLSLAVGTRVYIYIQYNSIGEWEHVSSLAGTVLRTFSMPIRPKRCDHLRLRIVGEGEAKIFSITKTIEQGSDI